MYALQPLPLAKKIIQREKPWRGARVIEQKVGCLLYTWLIRFSSLEPHMKLPRVIFEQKAISKPWVWPSNNKNPKRDEYLGWQFRWDAVVRHLWSISHKSKCLDKPHIDIQKQLQGIDKDKNLTMLFIDLNDRKCEIKKKKKRENKFVENKTAILESNWKSKIKIKYLELGKWRPKFSEAVRTKKHCMKPLSSQAYLTRKKGSNFRTEPWYSGQGTCLAWNQTDFDTLDPIMGPQAWPVMIQEHRSRNKDNQLDPSRENRLLLRWSQEETKYE